MIATPHAGNFDEIDGPRAFRQTLMACIQVVVEAARQACAAAVTVSTK